MRIETPRLILREIDMERDFEPWAAAHADEETVRYLGGRVMNRAQVWRSMASICRTAGRIRTARSAATVGTPGGRERPERGRVTLRGSLKLKRSPVPAIADPQRLTMAGSGTR